MSPTTARFTIVVAVLLLAAPLTAEPQRAEKVWRVGILFVQEGGGVTPYFQAIVRGFQDIGYVEGRNLAIEFRSAEGNTSRLPELAADLVRANVDLIMASGTAATRAAAASTSTLPIVMLGAYYPVERGLVVSIARPGGNVTGIATAFDRAFFGKILQILKEAAPKASRVAYLTTSPPPGRQVLHETMVEMSQQVGLTLLPVFLDRSEKLQDALEAARRARADALFADTPVTIRSRHELVAFASKHRLPLMSLYRELVEVGGLLTYSANLFELFRRAPIFADRIFKGAKPGDLPVEQPTEFELVINLKTAKALGLTIPPSLLLRADHVIE